MTRLAMKDSARSTASSVGRVRCPAPHPDENALAMACHAFLLEGSLKDP